MIPTPFLAATRPHLDASELVARFGAEAAAVARARAEASRRVGNHIHFCRWREVERMLATFGEVAAGRTLH